LKIYKIPGDTVREIGNIVLAQLIFYGSPTRVAVSCIYNSLGTYPWKPKLFQATSSQMSKLDFGTGPKEAVMTKKEI
jgi:hypothetical protein